MHLAIHTVDLSRNASTGQGQSKIMQTLYSSIPCTVLPMDNQSTIDNGWEFGQGYEVYFDPSQDIKKGDKLTWNGNKLIVQGIKDYSGMPLVAHLQAICQKEAA